MLSAGTPIRASRVRLRGGLPLLVALLLTLLQAGTPFVHVLLHVASPALHVQAQGYRSSQAKHANLHATGAEERPCPLCAADELSAIPVLPRAETALHAAPATYRAVASLQRPAQPLDVFCRPPPVA